MNPLFRYLALITSTFLSWNFSFGEVFNTSKSFDLFCSPQYIDHFKEEKRFTKLCSDSIFIANISDVKSPDLDLKYIDFAECEKGDYRRIESKVLNGGYKGFLFDKIDGVGWIKPTSDLK